MKWIGKENIHKFLNDIKFESTYPSVPLSPKPDISLPQQLKRSLSVKSISIQIRQNKRQELSLLFQGKSNYIETTADPSQVTPFHDSVQGSPLSLFQFVSWEGLLSEVYRTWRPETAIHEKKMQTRSSYLGYQMIRGTFFPLQGVRENTQHSKKKKEKSC